MKEFSLATSTDLILQLPVLVLLLTGVIVMMLDAFKQYASLAIISGVGIIVSIVLSLPPVMEAMLGLGVSESIPNFAFSEMMRTDGMASLVHIFLCLSGLFTLFFVGDFMNRQIARVYDVYALILFALVGMSLLANGNDLIMIFIGLETMSICLYIMAAMYKKDVKSNEAGLKYFLLGAFATGFFLYGIALVYGAAGSTNFSEMDYGDLATSPLFYPGIGLMIIGFLFKVAAFPFHAWTPDVYSGTPTPLAGFMATGSKMAAFVALAYFSAQCASHEAGDKIQTILVVVAVLTMIFGNVVAARQRNLKRMLAYSSIAHSGYVLLAVAAAAKSPSGNLDAFIPQEAIMAVIFYMFIYTLMNIGAFGLIGMAERKSEDVSMDNWRGFGRHNPWLGVALTIFLLSLAGIPPLAGFMGKYFVFKVAVDAGMIIPAIIGVLASVIGAYYYINVIKVMYFDDRDEPSVISSKKIAPVAGLVILVVLIVAFGVYPTVVQDWISGAMFPF